MADSRLTIQENEFNAIKSIYGSENITDLRTLDVWHIQRPPEYKIHLEPSTSISQNDAAYCYLDLKIKISESYPDVIPEFDIIDFKGLSEKQALSLLKVAVDEAGQLIGNEMIYNITCKLQDLLYSYNKPEIKSFYEQMI